MKILLAPSESKISGGDLEFQISKLSFNDELGELRSSLWQKYLAVLNSGDDEQISLMSGLKTGIPKNDNLALKAVERYSGVAFEHLDYKSLDKKAKGYLKENLLIFSNLFGVLACEDKIVNYKLKQGSKCAGIDTANYYKNALSALLDTKLVGQEILDLRAGFYDKFYVPKGEFIALKFTKNQKVVSHYAKAYRGLVLRYLAQNACESFKDFLALKIPNLKLNEITQIKNKITYSFEISQD